MDVFSWPVIAYTAVRQQWHKEMLWDLNVCVSLSICLLGLSTEVGVKLPTLTVKSCKMLKNLIDKDA